MRLGNRQFSVPSPAVTAAYLIVSSLMLVLGVWQLQRAEEKIQMASDATLANKQPAWDLNTLNSSTDSAIESKLGAGSYIRVKFTGRVQIDRQFLWDNRIHKGRVGYEVIAPVELTLASGRKRLVWVNRGWVPLQSSRKNLPDVSLLNDSLEMEGTLTAPSRGFASGEALGGSHEGWPKVIQYLDYKAMAEVAGFTESSENAEPVQGLIQSLQKVSSASANQASGLSEQTMFLDIWKPVANGPEKHYGYAFQWFAMFVALSILFLMLNTRAVTSNDPGTNGV